MEKTAVVLAGGGSRGAYQIGVWKAMRELHIDYQLVAGTSVGALNGALMVQQEYDKALQVWENISSQEIVGDAIPQQDDPDDRFLRRAFARQAFAHGGVELSALEHFVSRLVDEERFWDSPVDFALVTVEYPSLKPLELMKKDIPRGKLQEYLMASAACFPAFQTKEIDGRRYMDGGYHDNMPVNLALKMGADRVIAVDLESIGITHRVRDPEKQVTLICSLWPLGSFLKFEEKLARRNIQLGYLDARKACGEADGQLYTFQKDSAFFYTAVLRAQSEKLFERARQRDERSFMALRAGVMRRMLRQFRRRAVRTGKPVVFTLSRQMMMAAEFLGEALGVSPEREYAFGDFLQELLCAAKEARQRPVDWENWSDLRTLGEELQKLDRAFVVLLIRERIDSVLSGGGSLAEFLFAAAFWKELAAAIFLYFIEQPDSGFASLRQPGQHDE